MDAFEAERAQDLSAGQKRHRQVGVHTGRLQQGRGLAGAGDVPEVPAGGLGHQHRPAGAHAPGDQTVAVVGGESSGHVGGRPCRCAGGCRGDGGDTESGGAGVRGGASPQNAVEHVDRGHVGQVRYDDAGQLVRRPLHVESRTDGGGGVGDQGQAVAGAGHGLGGLVAFANVDDGGGQADHPAGGVVQPVVRHGPGALVVRIGTGADDDVPVGHRLPGLQGLAHPGFDGLGVQEGEDLADAPAQMFGGRAAVDAFQRRVHGHVAQVGIEDGQADRGLGDQACGEGDAPLDPCHRRLVHGQAQGVGVPEVVEQPHVAELHQPCAAVLVPDRKGSGPVGAGLHGLGEQRDHPVPVLLVDQQARREPAQRLLRAVAEQFLRLGAPEDHAPVCVEDHRGDAQQVEQAGGRRAGTGRGPARGAGS